MIAFEKTYKQYRILSPLKNFAEDTVKFEYRTDPLTGRNTTVIKGMINYITKFLISDAELLNSLKEKTRVNCPFCPESVRTKTPAFTADFVSEGRFFVGNTVIIPNLLGHAEQSVLAILSQEHHLSLEDFAPQLIFDAFKGGVKYLKRLSQFDPSIKFPVFIFNYLPPAGSSIFHPHMQILARDRPFHLTKLLMEKSKAYYENNKISYWSTLAAEEKGGERRLFETNGVEWLVPFAPLRGLNEAQAIVQGKSHLLKLNDSEWLGLAEGIAKILKFYHSQGYVSFNAILLSGPMDEDLEYFDVNLRIMSRPSIQPLCFTDAWALPYLLWDGEAVEEPEKFAERVRAFLKEAEQ